MPQLRRWFATKTPDEIGEYSIDFDKDVPTGATLDTTAWSIAVDYTLPGATVDPNPGAMLATATDPIGSVAVQTIQGGVAGNNYRVMAEGTMSTGEIVELWTILPVRAP